MNAELQKYKDEVAPQIEKFCECFNGLEKTLKPWLEGIYTTEIQEAKDADEAILIKEAKDADVFVDKVEIKKIPSDRINKTGEDTLCNLLKKNDGLHRRRPFYRCEHYGSH